MHATSLGLGWPMQLIATRENPKNKPVLGLIALLFGVSDDSCYLAISGRSNSAPLRYKLHKPSKWACVAGAFQIGGSYIITNVPKHNVLNTYFGCNKIF